jgi:hypothetical protein
VNEPAGSGSDSLNGCPRIRSISEKDRKLDAPLCKVINQNCRSLPLISHRTQHKTGNTKN